jgi:prophage regulatory protein
MQLIKTHYSLAEAAELAKCKPGDLLHQGVQRNIKLLVGVPDWVDIRVYDELTKADVEPFLITPQLLVLSQSHCLKIEVNGRTEQSDFTEGYCVDSSGKLEIKLPNFGHPALNHRWVYWRTYRDQLVYILELTPDRLFVIHSDLNKLMGQADQPPESRKENSTKRKAKSDADAASKLQTASEIVSDDSAIPMPNAEVEKPKPKNADDDIISPSKNQPERKSEFLKSNHAILRIDEVEERTGLSRSTIYDRLNPKSPRYDPAFPKQVSIGTGSVGWIKSEIQTWLESCINSSRRVFGQATHASSAAAESKEERVLRLKKQIAKLRLFR